jgi:flagellar hook-associated protein FlgK
MVRARVTLNTRFQRSQLVRKSERIDVQRLYAQNEEFATKMTAELDDVNSQYETLDELNNKIVETIRGSWNPNANPFKRKSQSLVEKH